jgi:hypothetical protein
MGSRLGRNAARDETVALEVKGNRRRVDARPSPYV